MPTEAAALCQVTASRFQRGAVFERCEWAGHLRLADQLPEKWRAERQSVGRRAWCVALVAGRWSAKLPGCRARFFNTGAQPPGEPFGEPANEPTSSSKSLPENVHWLNSYHWPHRLPQPQRENQWCRAERGRMLLCDFSCKGTRGATVHDLPIF